MDSLWEIIIIVVGIIMTFYIGRMGHYGSLKVPTLFWGRPGLLKLAGSVGPIMVIGGIILLVV